MQTLLIIILISIIMFFLGGGILVDGIIKKFIKRKKFEWEGKYYSIKEIEIKDET